ncbi:TPD1 protein homolog 1 [Musa acuminata AAA Group]|uniref:TPD1 protein homolog 1 n=1 Tax=Musa acuminata AAA Group TaxID=214697 RepID=UPI0031DF8D45
MLGEGSRSPDQRRRGGVSGRRMAVAAASATASVVALLLLLTLGCYWPRLDGRQFGFGFRFQQLRSVSVSNRKLLQVDAGAKSSSSSSSSSSASASRSTDRMGDRCSVDDIEVNQGATPPLPSGIPTYTVTVLNLCSSRNGCAMGQIHLSCGAFSSTRLINPRIFRRLRINDCLVNDGRPLAPGASISFQYANSFSYPLSVSSATCVPS